jgi:uncharacterized protein (UPF0548 family)
MRQTHAVTAVSYAAVGATQAADLLQYPPNGYRAIERRARVGHGEARFEYAWSEAMSWGIQKHSGFRVRQLETAVDTDADDRYTPVIFDELGTPLAPDESEVHAVFGADGTPFLQAGDSIELIIPFGPFSVKAPARVVYVIDEPTRKGFAYGTMIGHPEDGEEAFIVDHRDDGSVWLTIRAFSRPASWYWWLVYPVLRISQEYYTRRYLRALSGPID